MVEQQPSWSIPAQTGSRRNAKTGVHSRAIPRLRISFHPLLWLRGYPLALPTLLLAIAGLVYMLQMNQSAMLDYQLQNIVTRQDQVNGRLGQLAATVDRLKSCAYVCTAASSRFHMTQPTLVGAFWLTVQVPKTLPQRPREHPIRAGPLVWLSNAAAAIRNSL